MPEAGFPTRAPYATEAGCVRGGATAVAASDSTTFSPPLRGLYVAVEGTLVLVFTDGSEVTLTNVAAGVLHPIADVVKVKAASTATGIVGWKG